VREGGGQDDGDASRSELAAVVAQDERIEEARCVRSLPFGDDDKLAISVRQIVEARAGEADVARAAEAGGGTIAAAAHSAWTVSPAPRTRSPRSPAGPLALRRMARVAVSIDALDRVAFHDVMRSSRHIGPRCGSALDAGVVRRAGVIGSRSPAPAPPWRRDVRERGAAVHRLALDREPQVGETGLPRGERPAGGQPKPAAPQLTKRSTHVLAVKPRRARRIADAHHEPAADRQGGAHSREHRVLIGDADVVQHVQDDDGVDGSEAVVRMSPQTISMPSPSACRARSTSRSSGSMPLTRTSTGARPSRSAMTSRAACAAAASRLARS
jgi:hypothetical protein